MPPLRHRHSELVWEHSAPHLHWLWAYDEEQHGSAPLDWHQDFAEARERLHDWVAACGSRRGRDRATRQTAWPGNEATPSVEEVAIDDRRVRQRAPTAPRLSSWLEQQAAADRSNQRAGHAIREAQVSV